MSAEEAPTLHAACVRHVLRSLDGDVATLCAAACVSRAWRATVSDGWLWPTFSIDERVAERLTDARLAALITRAAGGLRRLDLTACGGLSVAGVLAALHGHPKLSLLHVRGVRLNPPRQQQPADDEAPRLTPEAAHRALRAAVVAQRTDLDARRPWLCCNHDQECGRLCRGPRNWLYEPVEDDWSLDSDGESDGSDVMSQGDGCADCDEPCGHVYCHVCVATAADAGELLCLIQCTLCAATCSRSRIADDNWRIKPCADCGVNVCDDCKRQRECAGPCSQQLELRIWRCPPCAETALRTCGACGALVCVNDCGIGDRSATCAGDGCAVLVCGTCTHGAWARLHWPSEEHTGCKDVLHCSEPCRSVFCPACAPAAAAATAAAQRPLRNLQCRNCSAETERMERFRAAGRAQREAAGNTHVADG